MTTGEDTIRFDPHVHTIASYDSVGSVDEVLSAAEDASLDAIAITDHDTVSAARRAMDLREEYDVCVVPGVEVSTADGHLLALGVEELPPIDTPISETVAWVRSAGGVTVVPHPFQRSRHGVRKRDLSDADGIEIFNAWAMSGIQNHRARLFANRQGYPCFGGSDAHHPGMVGYAYTTLPGLGTDDQPLTASEVLEGLARGNTGARGTSASIGEYIGKYTRSVSLKTLSTVEQTVFGTE